MEYRLDQFSALLCRENFSLAEACLLIAQDAYPDLDVAHCLSRIDALAATVKRRLPSDAFAEQKVVVLNRYLFNELGFSGNAHDYYDPRNSYLNQVLERRIGVPITLSILYMEIGQRLGLRLQGVSFPGHFLVKLRVTGGQLVIDPFCGGETQSESDLRARLALVLPQREADTLPLPRFLQAATSRQILARVLRNLKGIYLQSGKAQNTLEVMQRMVMVAPHAAEEVRDRGLAYYKLDCFRAALADLQDYLERRPDAADADEIRDKAAVLRLLCSRLN
ncbi:MAG: tetratricopeptide repeat protein [Betaproteobacteria bacterium]|nr:MAG: tetratricopeptide repeat protein [Betaproteobacteria bacterium]